MDETKMIMNSEGQECQATVSSREEAETANVTTTDTTDKAEQNFSRGDFLRMSAYLSDNYANLLLQKAKVENWRDGRLSFTKDMAIQELLSLTAPSDKESVQTSSISDQTWRIARELASGYTERRKRQLELEAAAMEKELTYVNWKISVIEGAMKSRMSKDEAIFYKLMFLKHKTYREIREAHKAGKIYDAAIKKRKDAVIGMVADQVMLCFCDSGQKSSVYKLAEEVRQEKEYINGVRSYEPRPHSNRPQGGKPHNNVVKGAADG